jgi:hypothetical protein
MIHMLPAGNHVSEPVAASYCIIVSNSARIALSAGIAGTRAGSAIVKIHSDPNSFQFLKAIARSDPSMESTRRRVRKAC